MKTLTKQICIFLLTATCLMPAITQAQNVDVNTTGSTPNASARLDIDFTKLFFRISSWNWLRWRQ